MTELRVTFDGTETQEQIEARVAEAFAPVHVMLEGLRRDAIRAAWHPHPGRHRYRLLVNMPHPVTGLPTYVGCEKCGKPKP
jgi:hypothetical protein